MGLAIADKLGITSSTLQRWYALTPADILRHGGLSIRWQYRNSIPTLANIIYPEHKWDRSRFAPLPNDELETDRANIRAALLHIADRLGFDGSKMESWYKVTSKVLRPTGVLTFHPRYHSRHDLLRVAFPDHPWELERFTRKTRAHWKSIENKRAFVESLGEKLGIKKGDYEAWYNVPGIMRMIPYGAWLRQTRHQFFSSIFPEHKWSRHLFVSSSVDIMNASDDVILPFVKDLERLLGITSPLGWYEVASRDLHRLGYSRKTFVTQGYLLHILQIAYPSIDWDPGRLRFAANGSGSLFSNVVKLFGRDFKLPSQIPQIPLSDRSADFEKVFLVPKLKLLFDYHGPQYYSQQIVEKKDPIESHDRLSLQVWCKDNGYTLISIPFWFGRDKKYLLAELWALKPELFTEKGPLHSYKELAHLTPREPYSIPRKDLSINSNYHKLWKTLS